MKASKEDLISRVMMFQMYGQVMNAAYDALRSHGVDYRKLPEYSDITLLDEARKLKPTAAQEKVIAYLMRLENAIKAAIRRKSLKVVQDNTKPPTQTK